MTLQKHTEIKNKIISAFDQALAKGDWESTLFFRTLGKKLREIREALVNDFSAHEKHLITSSEPAPAISREGYTQVYISIYQANCNSLEKWRNAIKTLAEYSLSRPIYRDEQHIQALIRSKTDKRREGYVTAYVKDTDILQPYAGKAIEDRFGHELLTVKEGAVKLENIVAFVYEGKSYSLHNGELVGSVVNSTET